jgi:hypothetical protein
MDKSREHFARQAQWQASRKKSSWPEKVHQAEAMRESILALRRTKPDSPRGHTNDADADSAA